MAKPKHPGRTPAERRALDEMGAGHHPAVHPDVLKRMIAGGLVAEIDARHEPGVLGTVVVHQYEMTSATHRAWCDYCEGEF